MNDVFDEEGPDSLAAVVLDGVESQSLRRVLEYLVRRGDVQRACILKEMFNATSEQKV